MDSKTLRVRARGEALVHCLEAMNASQRRYIGRKWVEVSPNTWSPVATEETVEVPNIAEYRACVADGTLWAADAETAAVCGVSFDPNFGAKPTTKPAPRAEKD